MSDVYKANVRGAARRARDLRAGSRRAQRQIVDEMARLGERARAIFYDHAPKDTRQFADSLEVRFGRRTVRPSLTVSIDGDRDGFDLLNVSRFGHDTVTIYPDQTRRAVSESTGRAHAPALAVHVNGRFSAPIYRGSVSGFFPTRDWVDDAQWEVDEHADIAQERLGRRIERSLR